MKLTYALLLASAFAAALTLDQAKGMSSGDLKDRIFELGRPNRLTDDADAVFPNLEEMKLEHFEAFTPTQMANLLYVHFDTVLDPAYHHEAVTSFKNIPAKFFEDQAFFYHVVEAASKVAGVKIFTMMSPKQFQKVMGIKGDFHPEITANDLNDLYKHLEAQGKTKREYFRHVSIPFLNHIFGNKDSILKTEIFKYLPDTFMNEVANLPHDDNIGNSLTIEQIERINLKKAKAANLKQKISLIDLPGIKFLEDPATIRKADLTKEQMEHLLPKQTTALIKKTESCRKLKVDKIRKIEEVEFDDESAEECFAALPAEVQSLFLMKHGKLPKTIASRVTKDMVNAWTNGDVSGVEFLRKIKNQAIVPLIGSHEDVSAENTHCAGLDADELKKNKTLFANITAKCLEASSVKLPTKLSDLGKHADLYCGLEGIFEAIQEIDGKKSEKYDEATEKAVEKAAKKGETVQPAPRASIWASMSKTLAAKLFGPAHSVLAAEMNKAAFVQMPEEALSELTPASVASLTFLKDLPKETIQKLPETAFSAVTEKHVGTLRLADVTDAQLAKVSIGSCESFFAKVSAEELTKEESRFGHLAAEQVGALSPKTFMSVISKSTIVKLSPEATQMITAEQLNTVDFEVIGAISAAQVENIGSKIEDQKLSGLAVLLANKKYLSSEAVAALNKRCPGNSASRTTFSVLGAAAVAVIALLA